MKKYVESSMTFDEYVALIDRLLLDGKTTGPNQSEAMVHYGVLNRQRMRRLEKTIKLNESTIDAARNTDHKMVWLILTEGWCGDAAQNIPVIEKIAAESVNIFTRYLLRDENPGLMNKFLTYNARSIPKLIALDGNSFELLGTWGPRPKELMEHFFEMRDGGMESSLIKENIQRWYLKNKGQAVQKEFEGLLINWNNSELFRAA
ncbi:MAG: thioredoxin family protein [Acidobacteria bacterium]|nr:thioredoxin family protein [Acidobacteriota bacterium]